MKTSIILITFFFTIMALSCNKTSSAPPEPEPIDSVILTPYDIQMPGHFPEMIIPADNPPYVERIRLGRMLYYDPRLSNDGRACGSCHLQSKGFTRDALYMVGTSGMPVLPHENLAWNNNFMWDGSKTGTLEDVMEFEVKDFFQTNLSKINSDSTYNSLFRKHFGVKTITYKELAYALAQFQRTVISRNTKYDRFIKGEENLTYDEMEGRNLFFTEKGDCFHCHTNPVMTDNQLHNTGLDSLYSKEMDKGLFNVTGKTNDLGKFKTPNLRNVMLRKNYMHDGRFGTIEEVIEFYNSGVRKVANLDPIMTKPGKENGLKLTAQQKYQLVQFLKTLTDQSFITDTTLGPL
jgi:cytochrome c peroxidase